HGSGPHGPSRAPACGTDLPRFVRLDASVRYVEPLCCVPRHDRPRHPRTPQGAGPARLRAAQAPRRAARRPFRRRLVRLAVSRARPPRAGRAGEGGRGQHPHRPRRALERVARRRARRLPRPAPAGHRRAQQEGVRHHATRRDPAARPAHRPAPLRRPDVRAEGRVLPPPRRRAAPRAVRASPRRGAVAHRRTPSRARARARPLLAHVARTRRRVLVQRPRLARPPHRGRAGTTQRGTALMTGTIRLAIAGVGNCASSLLQGIEFYKDADPAERVPGLMHVDLGGYHIRDIELVAAFDVDANKVGIDASKAAFAGPNNTIKFSEVPHLGVTVQRGPTFDGFGEYYRQTCEESPAEPVDVAQVLRDTKADVLVSYLPVGSDQAQKYYAQACLDSGVAFVNAIPVFIASDPEWAQRFTDAGVPIVGDDIKSQVGATIVHRTLARLFEDRGTTIDHTYQLNFGGNMDFMNMLERSRL